MRGFLQLLGSLVELYLYTYRQVWVLVALCFFLPFSYSVLSAWVLAYFYVYFRRREEEALKKAREHGARNWESK